MFGAPLASALPVRFSKNPLPSSSPGSSRAMTANVDAPSPSRSATRPSCSETFAPQEIKGAGKTGCALHPRSRVQLHTAKRTRAYRFSGNTPAFPAQWFYGLFRALPGERALLPPSLLRSLLLRNLAPASRRQDHTTSPSARPAFVSRKLRVHRIPPRVS